MSPTIRHKCKYFPSAAQRAKDRRQKFHLCRLQFDVRPRNGKLNLSNVNIITFAINVIFSPGNKHPKMIRNKFKMHGRDVTKFIIINEKTLQNLTSRYKQYVCP